MVKLRRVSGFEYFLAIGIRFALLKSDFKYAIHDRVEISTPLNSWKRLQEGIYLFNENVDPYSGDLFHESPLILITFRYLIHYLGPWTELLFIVVDVIAACLLYEAAVDYISCLKKEEGLKIENGEFSKGIDGLLITEWDVENLPAFVAYAYLFSPYIILNCVGLTTTGLTNLMLAGIFYSMIKKKKLLCVLFLSLVTFQTFYPLFLIVPVCLQFYNVEKKLKCVTEILLVFIVSLGSLFMLCYYISGSWKFIPMTYGFILYVHDLTPNIGLFWYFFTEMFEHFRALFIIALQINATVLYLFPLALLLKREPVFLLLILVGLNEVFKSYPNLGGVGFYFSLLPLWKHLFFFMQQSFFIACIIIITSIFGPTVWHLWIYAGSANANFFFGVTLAFATAQIFLLTDLLFAHKKRAFALKNGLPEDASENTLVLD